MIQDIYPDRLYNEYRKDAVCSPDSRVLCFSGKKVLARYIGEESRKYLEFPTVSMLNNAPVYAFAVNDTEYFMDTSDTVYELNGFSYLDIREIRGNIQNVSGLIIYTGMHLYIWYRESRYCGVCGTATVHSNTERARCCPKCGHTIYPSLFPAVIVGVTNGDRLLLTKYRTGFGHYAMVAGFVEIGETLEEAVAREVMEETGLKVKNIRYYKSQPWGMVKDILAGFYCDVDGNTDIIMDRNELKLAEWKKRNEIELQPDDFSLTNEMMKMFRDGLV